MKPIKWALALTLMIAPSVLAQKSGPNQENTDARKNLKVVVIAIEDFNDPDFQNPILNKNIGIAADEVVAFFAKYFPTAEIKVIRDLPEDQTLNPVDTRTTSAALKEFFSDEFPNRILDGNITVLFIISHGVKRPYHNGKSESDLLIITSDTKAAELPGRTLWLSSDIVAHLNGLKRGTFLLGFIDTCDAGAADNIALNVQAAIQKQDDMQTMLWGASVSDTDDMQANFTRALIQIWTDAKEGPNEDGQLPCTNTANTPFKVHKAMNKLIAPKSLPENEGIPAWLISTPTFGCLETFGKNSAIVQVRNGTKDDIQVQFKSTLTGELAGSWPVPKTSGAAIWLPRGSYSMITLRGPDSIDTKDFDFKDSGIGLYEVPGGTYAVAETAHDLARAASSGAAAGLGQRDVDVYNQLAMIKFESIEDSANADRLATLLGKLPSPTAFEATVNDPASASVAEPDPHSLSNSFTESSREGTAVAYKSDKHSITVKFDYDFSRARACSPGVKRRCVQKFVVFVKDKRNNWEEKVLTIPAPAGAVEFTKGITATTPPITITPGRYELGVAAFGANGDQSDINASRAKILIKHCIPCIIAF